MIRLFFTLALAGIFFTCAAALTQRYQKASDSYVRQAVVQLRGVEGGGCTGVQIQAKSGALYVLTAAHCLPLQDAMGKILAESEGGQKAYLSIVKEDDKSDLLLLTGSNIFGHVDVATDLKMYEKVHTMTHGGLAPSYRTDGEALDLVWGGFMVSIIMDQADEDACLFLPKHTVLHDLFISYCVLDVQSTRATAQIIPGSSGGPLLNAAGELVGIASYGRTDQATFGYFVSLKAIRLFLAKTAI